MAHEPLGQTPFNIERSKTFWARWRKKSSTVWVEDSFTFEKPHPKQVSLSGNTEHLGSSLSLKNLAVFFMIFFLSFVIVTGRLIDLQVVHGKTYLNRSEKNRERVNAIPAERGLIFDRQGRQLTKNIPKLSLVLVPQEVPRTIPEREQLIRRLAAITGRESRDIRDYIIHFIPAVLADNIPYETALQLQIEASDLPGIAITQGSKRLYLYGATSTPGTASSTMVLSLSHILGYEGKISEPELATLADKGYLPSDSLGKTGVEKMYETYLRGTYGIRRREVDFLEREQKILAETPPVTGHHLFLSIDLLMQQKVEELLQHALATYGKKRGAAIALDPNSGEILALVSLPAFNNNDFSGGIDADIYAAYLANPDNPLFNRAVAGTYPSGSTIKPAIAAAALEEGIIKPQTSFVSTGGLQVGSWFFPDWLSGGHGVTNVRKSLAWSVNTFYYYIGGGYGSFTGLGVETITNYLRKFGFGERLGVDLPGERRGFLPSKQWKEETKKERWYIGDTYNLSIGQGDLLVTPLQIASLTATVGNGGTLYVPHVVRAIQAPESDEKEMVKSKVINGQVVGQDIIEVVRAGMRDCVTVGSCQRLNTLPGLIAGKTGTAQWSNTKDPHAWFTSFAPYDKPRIVFTVIVEEGEGGSTAALPVAYEFYKWWAGYNPNAE